MPPNRTLLHYPTMNFNRNHNDLMIEKLIRAKYRPQKGPSVQNSNASPPLRKQTKLERKITLLEQNNKMDVISRKQTILDGRDDSQSTMQGVMRAQTSFVTENDLSETESFIIYAIALMYLSGSFQVSMGICNSNFKSKVENKIAQATILRFKALNFEQMALKLDQDKLSHSSYELHTRRQKYLESGIVCVRKALKLYE